MTKGTDDLAERAADSMAFLSKLEKSAREACSYIISDAYQNAWLVIRDQRATIERLERERDEAKAISQGWELQAGEAEAEAREGHWTDRYQGRPEGAYGWLSDEEVANKVRMLGRSDLDYEAVCTMARDRIAQLSREVRDLCAALPAAPEVPFSAAKNCRRKHGCFAPRPCNLVGECASPASAKTAEDRG